MKNKILILTGAGLSQESGLETFRGSANGMWNNYKVSEICTAKAFARNKQKVLDFYDIRRADLEGKKPNKAHSMIAKMKEKYSDRIFVITQNVDDLLEQAGCKDVIHLHGKLKELRCQKCNHTFNIECKSIKEFASCPKCNSEKIRHNVVMFEEAAPEYQTLSRALNQTELLIVIGTSGQVLPVEYYARTVMSSILNNLEPNISIIDDVFTEVLYSKATEAAGKIEGFIEKYIETGYI